MANLKNYNHIMLDLETLALDKRVVIIQIGAIICNNKWEILKEKQYSLDVVSQLYKDRKVQQSTLDFWSNKKETFKETLKNPQKVENVITDLLNVCDIILEGNLENTL